MGATQNAERPVLASRVNQEGAVARNIRKMLGLAETEGG